MKIGKNLTSGQGKNRLRQLGDSLRHKHYQDHPGGAPELGYCVIRSRAALISSLLILAAAPAWAATVTMLQFGSFETRAEAEARATEVKQKHAGVVGAMDVSIREVKLPPDNLTVYRTQAGPVASKAAAQSICSQLAANGDECYVVETAMLDSAKLTASAASVTHDAAASVSAPIGAVVGQAKQTAAAASQAVAKNTATGVDSAHEAIAQPLAQLASSARDPQSVAALAGVNAAPAAVAALTNTASAAAPIRPALAPLADGATEVPLPDAVAAQPPAPPSPELQAALNKAIADQDAVAASLAAPAPAAPDAPAPRSFWARLNPFSESAAAAAPAAAPLPPVAVTAAAPVPVVPPMPPEPAPTPVIAAATPAPVVPATAPSPSPAPVLAAAAPLLLPPPPAPLKGFDAPRPPAPPEPTGALLSPPLAVSAKPVPPGNVRVEEAQRVPLTQATQPVFNPAVPVMSLSPSATLGQKTVWAQMGPFADTQEALAFWDQYRQLHPDFPVVRVRVTSSVQAQYRGDASQWLRVGPFAREGFVSTLCGSMFTAAGEPLREGMRCGRVVDLGVASSNTRVPGYLPGSRYSR